MPGGVALVSLLAPLLLKHHTWRSVWEANAILLVLLAVFIAAVAKRGVSATSGGSHGTFREMKEVFTSRGPLMLAIIFGMYTMQHLSVMGFMPSMLACPIFCTSCVVSVAQLLVYLDSCRRGRGDCCQAPRLLVRVSDSRATSAA